MRSPIAGTTRVPHAGARQARQTVAGTPVASGIESARLA
jgi:hypothetical protein